LNVKFPRFVINTEVWGWDVTVCNLADVYRTSNNKTATDIQAIVSQKALLCLYPCQTRLQDTPRRCFIVRRPR
jgi:hypothetical protein